MTDLAAYIWHADFCPAPAHEGDCNCGYAAAKTLAEKIQKQNETLQLYFDDAHAEREKLRAQIACVEHALNLALVPAIEERLHLDPCPATKLAAEIAAEVTKKLPALGAELQELVALAELTGVRENAAFTEREQEAQDGRRAE